MIPVIIQPGKEDNSLSPVDILAVGQLKGESRRLLHTSRHNLHIQHPTLRYIFSYYTHRNLWLEVSKSQLNLTSDLLTSEHKNHKTPCRLSHHSSASVIWTRGPHPPLHLLHRPEASDGSRSSRCEDCGVQLHPQVSMEAFHVRSYPCLSELTAIVRLPPAQEKCY